MLDLACIITTGGVILFYKAFCQVNQDILNRLIQDGLLSSKIQTSMLIESRRLKWLIVNELQLIFVVAYQETFALTYVDVLLDTMREKFVKDLLPSIQKQAGLYKNVPTFDSHFDRIVNGWEQYCERKAEQSKEMSKPQNNQKGQKQQSKKPQQEEESSEDEPEEKTGASSPKSDDNETKQSKLEALKARKASKKPEPKVTSKSPPSEVKKKKEKADYHNINEKISKKDIDKLDFSSAGAKTQNVTQQQLQDKYNTSNEAEEQKILEKFIDSDEEIIFDSDDEKQKKGNEKVKQKSGMFSKLTNRIKNMTGNQEITEETLAPVLNEFKDGLMSKNVAEEIAEKICQNIKQKLMATKTKAFTSITRTVQECLRETLVKILTPNKNIDIIAEALRNKEKGRPYVMVFIGVNGVGKSTNLAKVAYLFKSQGFTVMIAACDNFRAGAVEQVKQHGECLGIPVFDRGYRDEPPEIAYQAVREATLKKIDVVLIDTAGRMQHNEPLMRALSRIVVMNNPDLICFVGEALVGNDGVDQLVNFNKALIDNSPRDRIREIDAIILSKFDTVDEKVGAALSLTSSTGKPIIFCGVGQKYTHLRKLNVNTVVQNLLS